MSLVLILLASIVLGQPSPDITQDTLSQRLCLNVIMGPEYLGQGLSSILTSYLRFHNDPFDYTVEAKAKKLERFKSLEHDRLKDIDVEFILPDKPRAIDTIKQTDGVDIEL